MNICPNCGSNLKNGDKFCRKCGTKVELINNDLKTLVKNITISDDDLINAYIGKNADKLKNGTFSVNTFFFGSLYVLYRKMWLLGIGWLAVNLIVGAFLEPISNIVSIVLSVVLGLKFKTLYLKHVTEEVNKIKIENNNASREQLMMICANKGGTSVLGVILPIITIFVLSFFAVLTDHDIDEDIDIKDDSDNTKTSLKEEGTLMDLSYKIPNVFDDRLESYSSASYTQKSNDSDKCKYITKILSSRLETDAKSYLERNVYKDNTELYDNIVIKNINGNNWYYTETNENNIINYYYATINGMFLYSVNYRIISDTNGTCKKAYSEIINSLEFK